MQRPPQPVHRGFRGGRGGHSCIRLQRPDRPRRHKQPSVVPHALAPQFPRPKLPNLSYTGRFFADPSTINNNIMRYDVAGFRPNYQDLRDDVNMNGSWNPEGTAFFHFDDCIVTGVQTISASVVKPATIPGLPDVSAEPLLGQIIQGNTASVQGKMADLDPQMQHCSTIYGAKFKLGKEDGPHLHGELVPCAMQDMWASIEQNVGLLSRSAMFQTILIIESFNAGSSPFLQDCEPFIEASRSVYPEGAMSVSFRLDNYETDATQDSYKYGNIVGYIEPWLPGSPQQVYASRKLLRHEGIDAQAAYCHLQQDSDGGKSFFMCLLNVLPRLTTTKYKDIGQLYLCSLPDGYNPVTGYNFNIIGEINYLEDGWEQRTGGIVQIPVPANLEDEVNNVPLAILSITGGAPTIVLCESNDGLFIRADTFCYRLNPDEEKKLEFYVVKFGQRTSAEIKIGFDSTAMVGTGESRTDPAPVPGVPACAVIINGASAPSGAPKDNICTKPQDPVGSAGINGYDWETTVQADKNGYACVTLKGGDPKNARKFIDGQVYGLRYSADHPLPPLNASVPASDKVNVHVFDVFEAPDKPSWVVDIYPIFKQYANLYPSMNNVVRLADFGSVVDRRMALIGVFSAPEGDPHYMPVTRDLSINKREMILKWLKDVDMDPESPEYLAPVYMNINRKADLEAALQTVIELEHATIPPYLTALYSIKAGYNQYIADTLRHVVEEEMVHMCIACNIMISIGMNPQINKIAFVPKFPGLLPGGLRPGLVMRLRKCSVEQMRVFMSLEAPDQQKLPDEGEVKANRGDVQTNQYTIAFVYNKIIESLEALSASGDIKFPDTNVDPSTLDNQVVGPFPSKLFKIEDLETAKKAIEIIEKEGEGSSPTDPSEGNIDPATGLPDLAHFFRFAEIVKGRRIVSNPHGGFSYTGPKIEIDEGGIYNMQDDPNIKFLPMGSRARERMEAFAIKYQALLNGLHRAFNGDPAFFTETISQMYQLTISAKPLMELPAINMDGTPKDDGTTVGISFQVPFKDH